MEAKIKELLEQLATNEHTSRQTCALAHKLLAEYQAAFDQARAEGRREGLREALELTADYENGDRIWAVLHSRLATEGNDNE